MENNFIYICSNQNVKQMSYFKRKADLKRAEKAIELQKQLDQNYLKNDQTIEKGKGLNHEHYMKYLEETKGISSAYNKKCVDFCENVLLFCSNVRMAEMARIAIMTNCAPSLIKAFMGEYAHNPSSLKSALGVRLLNIFVERFINK